MENLTIPYIIEGEVDIDGNLTIEPGTQFRFEAAGWFAIGYYAATTFIADGTSASPIKFTSNASSPVAGSWRGITFMIIPDKFKMNYCIFDYAGSNVNEGALYMSGTSSIIFTNSTIRTAAVMV